MRSDFAKPRSLGHDPAMIDPLPGRKRNRAYDETHQALIETAVRLISEQGEAAVSIAALARATGIDRTTVYYHFRTRDEVMRAVRLWSSQQLATAFTGPGSQDERIDHIARFVLGHPALIQLWIADLLSGSDIRDSYPHWDELVEAITAMAANQGVDPEIFCTILIAGSVIGPRVFRNAVRPDLTDEEVITRFRHEQKRLLKGLN